jgi:hypothetical protein
LISMGDDQGRKTGGCQVRLTGRLEDVWSTWRIFPFEIDDDGDDDRWRFDVIEGEYVWESSLVFVLIFDVVKWRCGTKIFRRFDSINW